MSKFALLVQPKKVEKDEQLVAVRLEAALVGFASGGAFSIVHSRADLEPDQYRDKATRLGVIEDMKRHMALAVQATIKDAEVKETVLAV